MAGTILAPEISHGTLKSEIWRQVKFHQYVTEIASQCKGMFYIPHQISERVPGVNSPSSQTLFGI